MMSTAKQAGSTDRAYIQEDERHGFVQVAARPAVRLLHCTGVVLVPTPARMILENRD